MSLVAGSWKFAFSIGWHVNGSLCHHLPLKNVINLVGKTTTRQFVRLMHHAEGVVCPVTFAMHLAAAVETRPGRPKHRPCVVIGGGREPTQWEAYPFHQYISTVGMLSCCLDGGCWKSRCQLVGDGDPKDRNDLCAQPVQLTPERRIPKCLDMISADDVIRRIELYYQGGVMSLYEPPPVAAAAPLHNGHAPQAAVSAPKRGNPDKAPKDSPPNSNGAPAGVRNILLKFRHGLGDGIQLTAVLRHLRHYHPDWNVDVETLVGKHSAFRGLCRKVYVIDAHRFPTTNESSVRLQTIPSGRALERAMPNNWLH